MLIGYDVSCLAASPQIESIGELSSKRAAWLPDTVEAFESLCEHIGLSQAPAANPPCRGKNLLRRSGHC